VLIAPLLAAFAALKLKGSVFSRFRDWDEDAAWGSLMLAGAAALLAGAALFADPIAVSTSTCFALFAMGMLSGRTERSSVFGHCLLIGIATLAAGTAGVMMRGGPSILAEEWKRTADDDRSLVQILRDHPWLGCGMGTLGEVWPLYRTAPAQSSVRGGGLLALAAEGGASVPAIGTLVALYLTVRWRRICNRLPSDVRIAVGGAAAGLVGWFVLALLGVGPESPGVLVLAVALLGCLTRGLAGAFRLPERGLEA
jgi:hypothetical protein